MSAFIYTIVKDVCRCILKNALCIPTFKQNIFSGQVAAKNGVHIGFEHDNCQLIYPNKIVFNLTQDVCITSKILFLPEMPLRIYILDIKFKATVMNLISKSYPT